jgi:hypothetical protein
MPYPEKNRRIHRRFSPAPGLELSDNNKIKEMKERE